MANDQYTRVALDENDVETSPIEKSSGEDGFESTYSLKNCLGIFAVVVGIFATGFVSGGTWAGISKGVQAKANGRKGLLSPQSFIPESLCLPYIALMEELMMSSPNKGSGL
jgi:hypothetical protein